MTEQNENAMPDRTKVSPVRVCLISMRAYPLFNPSCPCIFGGAEVDQYLIATELAKDKAFQVSMIVGDYGQPAVEERENVTLIRSLDVSKNLILYGRKIWRAMQRADSGVYLCKGLSLGTFLYALFCARNRRAFVFRAANSGECDGSYIRQHSLRGRAVLWALRQAKARLVQNLADQENLWKTTGLDSLVIRNGMRIPAEASMPRDTVLWVGRNDSVKGPHRFLELARQFPAQPFTMICQKSPQGMSYESLAAEAGRLSNVTFLPRVPYSQMDSYFQRAKIVVNTSESEGFPNAMIQACQHGAAIVSWKVNPDGFLDQYRCGVCAGGDWKRFCDLFAAILEPGVAESHGLRGLRYAREFHDLSRIIERYKELFLRLAREAQAATNP